MLAAVEAQEQVELLVEQLVVVGEIEAEEGERLAVGAPAGGDLGASSRDQVERREVLEDLDRVRGREHRDGARETDPRGRLGDSREEHGRRCDGKVGAVELADAEDVEPGLVGKPGEVDELPQANPRFDGLTGHRVTGELTEGERPDLEWSCPGHRATSGFAGSSPSSQLRSSPSETGLRP